MSKPKHPDKLRRFEDAMRRQAERDERSPIEQLETLTERGHGPGKSAKERARMAAMANK
jgi:hypothetical protein